MLVRHKSSNLNSALASSRTLLVALLAVFLASSVATRSASASRDHKAFAALSARLSEPGGYFDSDNLISNETSYLHVIGKLRELGIKGGVYIGVGPDQSFSYIAKIRPKMAIMIDIRKDNQLQHLLFKALFARSRNRIEYLCTFFGKPFPKTKGWDARNVKDMIEYIDSTASDPKLFENTSREVRNQIQ